MLLFKYFPYYYKGKKLCKVDGFCGDCTSFSICGDDTTMLNCTSVASPIGSKLIIYTYK